MNAWSRWEHSGIIQENFFLFQEINFFCYRADEIDYKGQQPQKLSLSSTEIRANRNWFIQHSFTSYIAIWRHKNAHTNRFGEDGEEDSAWSCHLTNLISHRN